MALEDPEAASTAPERLGKRPGASRDPRGAWGDKNKSFEKSKIQNIFKFQKIFKTHQTPNAKQF